MANNQLKIVDVSQSINPKKPIPSRLTRRKEMQAQFERLWLLNPDQFNPLRNCMQKERLDRTWNLITSHIELKEKKIADLGCASGVFTRRLRDGGAHVEAIDIAENALKELKKHEMSNIEAKHSAMPETNLGDHAYDLVICTELIAYLNHDDHRIFFSELARLVKPDGLIVCSTPIDINTEGGIQRLLDLAITEFDIIDSKLSYHAWHIRLKNFLEAPSHYIQGSKEPAVREREIGSRTGFKRLWYRMNTTPYVAWLWKIINFAAAPALNLVKNNRSLLLALESICEFTRHEKGISHFIFVGKLRPLPTIDLEEIPVERPHKKEVWE